MTIGHCPLCGAVGNRVFPPQLAEVLPGAISRARARELLRIGEEAIFQALTREEGLHARTVQLNMPLGAGILEALLVIHWQIG